MIFQEISAGAISPQMPACRAIVVNVGETVGVTAALKELSSFQEYTVYVVNTSLSKLGQVLDRCSEVGVPAIVNCGEKLPETKVWHPEQKYSATLISPGSYSQNAPKEGNEEEDILNFILNDPFADSFSNIGYQSYRYSPDTMQKLQLRYFEEMRLGILRSNLTLCEPLVRNCEYAFIDMHSVRYSDYPHSGNSYPNGMYAEEICTVARYIGLSQRLKSIFLFGEECSNGELTICNRLISEVIWHICEGIASNIIENPNEKTAEELLQKKIVTLGENGEDITFITSYTTRRWWMEVPAKDGTNICVPCSIEDYKCACSGEIPLRWLFFYQKQAL